MKLRKNKRRPLPLSPCYYCICRVCNLLGCRYRTMLDRCLRCQQLNNVPILDCDGFQSKHEVRVFRISRDKLKHKSTTAMLREIYEAGKWRQ